MVNITGEFMRKSLFHYFIIGASLVSLVIFAGGFVWGVQNTLSSEASDLPTLPVESDRESGKMNLVALGDSLSRGIGDAEGKGYVGLLRVKLEEGNPEVQLANLAVSGATSEDLLEQLKERGTLRSISRADLITFTIGGNDLFRGGGGA